MTRLYTDPDGSGSFDQIQKYVEAVLRDNFDVKPDDVFTTHNLYERSSRAITFGILNRLGIKPIN